MEGKPLAHDDEHVWLLVVFHVLTPGVGCSPSSVMTWMHPSDSRQYVQTIVSIEAICINYDSGRL